MGALRDRISGFLHDQRGAGLLEYLIVAAFVGIAAAAIIGIKFKSAGQNVVDTGAGQLNTNIGKWTVGD